MGCTRHGKSQALLPKQVHSSLTLTEHLRCRSCATGLIQSSASNEVFEAECRGQMQLLTKLVQLTCRLDDTNTSTGFRGECVWMAA